MSLEVISRVDEFHSFREHTKHEPTCVILGVQGSGTNLLANILQAVFRFSVVRDRSLIVGAAARLPKTPHTPKSKSRSTRCWPLSFPGACKGDS